MTRVTLPDNARGVAMDGTNQYTAGPGDQVTVSPGHAEYIRQHAASSRGQFAVGTKRGMRCAPCARIWNAWSTVCPRCGERTEEAE